MQNNCLKPIFDRIKVIPDEDGEQKTSSGIIIATKEIDKKNITGVIVATGIGADDSLDVGDRILYGNHAGYKQWEDNDGNIMSDGIGRLYIYMNDIDVVAKYEKEESNE